MRTRPALLASALLALVGLTHRLSAQDVKAANAEDFAAKFTVPASPAFKLVDVGNSLILRPTNFQQLSATLGSFGLSSGTFSLPKEFGLELAPFFLAKAKSLSLQEYQKSAWLYRFRISAAAKRLGTSGGATDLALGFRFSPRDATDPRTAAIFVTPTTMLTSRLAGLCAALTTTSPATSANPSITASCADTRGRQKRLLDSVEVTEDSTRRQVFIDSLAQVRATIARFQPQIDSINRELTELRDSWGETAWNKSGIDFAAAYGARTADSLGRDPRFQSAAVWLSGAWPLGAWGQLIFGGTGRLVRDSITNQNDRELVLGTAFYVGTIRYKAFLELEAARREEKSSGMVANGGAELLLIDGVAAHLTAGWEKVPGETKGKLMTRFNIKTNLPFKLPNVSILGPRTPE